MTETPRKPLPIKKALITGITGQDGAYLTKFLLAKGYNVYGTVRDSIHTNPKNLSWLGIENSADLVTTNLLDLSNIIRLMETVQPDEIYNLASQSSVGLSFEQPLGTVEFNVSSTINLLEAIRVLSLNAKFYQASSSEMFGKVAELPVTEETRIHPVSPYGISKAAAHWITVNYRESYGLFSCCGILFNHESVLRGEQFVTKKVISTAVRISRGPNEKLTLGNLDIQRDWGYAPEYVKAMWTMLQQETPDDYIVATGVAHSLREFVQLVFAYLGLNWEDHVIIDKNLYRPSEMQIIYGDSTKAKSKLGWQPEVSFEDLIRTLVEQELGCEQTVSA